MGIFYRPSWLQKMFPGSFAAQPESSREKLRDVLLEAIEERANTSIRFDCGVWDIREGSRQNTAELLDRESKTLGEFKPKSSEPSRLKERKYNHIFPAKQTLLCCVWTKLCRKIVIDNNRKS